MGNCQASEAAVVVLQHPGGRIERLYWPTSASDVMRSNPGHYVALITTTTAAAVAPAQEGAAPGTAAVGKVTKVRLLRAKDTLMLGQVYRLVTSQEVLKGLRARKQEKIRIEAEVMRRQQQQQQQQEQPHHHRHHHRHHRAQQQPAEEDQSNPTQQSAAADAEPIDLEKMAQAASGADRHRQRAAAALRARNWRPSLQSIHEVNSK